MLELTVYPGVVPSNDALPPFLKISNARSAATLSLLLVA